MNLGGVTSNLITYEYAPIVMHPDGFDPDDFLATRLIYQLLSYQITIKNKSLTKKIIIK